MERKNGLPAVVDTALSTYKIILSEQLAPFDPEAQEGLWHDKDGNRIVLCHATPSGRIHPKNLEYMQPGDHVVCCYPNRVREQHPEFEVIGNWDGETCAYVFENMHLSKPGPSTLELRVSEALDE